MSVGVRCRCTTTCRSENHLHKKLRYWYWISVSTCMFITDTSFWFPCQWKSGTCNFVWDVELQYGLFYQAILYEYWRWNEQWNYTLTTIQLNKNRQEIKVLFWIMNNWQCFTGFRKAISVYGSVISVCQVYFTLVNLSFNAALGCFDIFFFCHTDFRIFLCNCEVIVYFQL